ncbi:MAG: asparagine--tRNA ligase [Clostridiales bacterium]|jgi:asparaginyl-tRNA synthetase|nr:asparagine--tRNA ligase [Clostridiales bacterium]
MRTRVADIYKDTAKYMGAAVRLGGWVRTLRDNKHFGFIELNDGSFFKGIQVVFNEDLPNFADIAKLLTGAAITVRGKLVESRGAGQAFEVVAQEIIVEGAAPEDYPLQKKRHNFETLRSMAHLRPRTNTFSAVFRVRSMAAYAFHKFFQERGFVQVHTPVITALDAEGAGEMFDVSTPGKDFFGNPAKLTVTGQLQLEAYALAFNDVYTFNPTFRAENSNTSRHLAEFWMLEPEIAFADLDDCIGLIEDMVKYTTGYILENAREEIEFFGKFIEKGLVERLQNVLESDFGRITYTDAITALEKSGEDFEYPISWGVSLQAEHERYLAEEMFKKPVFVTDYPKGVKAFYMRRNDDGKTVACTDLLVPHIGELVGGSQREERLEVLVAAMEEFGLNPGDYQWYLDLRRFGGVTHSGYGLGFERYIMYITGMTNIRDVIPFPRYVNHAEF